MNEIMSRKGRLVGAGVLIILGISCMALAQVPSLGLLNQLGISDIIAAASLISAVALYVYIPPEEHLWGSDDPVCNRESCRHIKH